MNEKNGGRTLVLRVDHSLDRKGRQLWSLEERTLERGEKVTGIHIYDLYRRCRYGTNLTHFHATLDRVLQRERLDHDHDIDCHCLHHEILQTLHEMHVLRHTRQLNQKQIQLQSRTSQLTRVMRISERKLRI